MKLRKRLQICASRLRRAARLSTTAGPSVRSDLAAYPGKLAEPVALAAGEQNRYAAGAGRGGHGNQPQLEVDPHHLLPVCSALAHGASPHPWDDSWRFSGMRMRLRPQACP